ncbi:MAG: transcription antitermination factor NusB [bacterium]
MTKRRKARELALQFLYEEDGDISNLDYKINRFYNDFAVESLKRDGFIKTKEDLNKKKDTGEIFDFFSSIVNGTLINLKKIDEVIKNISKNWSIERMSRVDRNLLRLSIYEIIFVPETPKNVVINEAVEIAKKFGNDESPAFINGILDAAIKVK